MILQINNLSVEYYRNKKTVPAVKNLSLGLESGESLIIVGESGSGKSTVAFSILNLIMPYEGRITSGEILFNDKPGSTVNLVKLNEQELEKIRGKRISMVFQDPFSSLNPVLTVGNQLLEICPDRNKINEYLELVQLTDNFGRIYNSYPHQLSGGQRQRICIAMAIINRPQILIADEPTTALDVTVQKEILELLWSLKDKFNMSIIFITHDLYLSGKGQKIAVMNNGRIVEYGDRNKVINNPGHPYTKSLLESVKKYRC